MRRSAVGLLALAGIGALSALVGSCAELVRFGWMPPVILAGSVVGYAAYRLGSELGDLADQQEAPITPEFPSTVLPDSIG